MRACCGAAGLPLAQAPGDLSPSPGDHGPLAQSSPYAARSHFHQSSGTRTRSLTRGHNAFSQSVWTHIILSFTDISTCSYICTCFHAHGPQGIYLHMHTPPHTPPHTHTCGFAHFLSVVGTSLHGALSCFVSTVTTPLQKETRALHLLRTVPLLLPPRSESTMILNRPVRPPLGLPSPSPRLRYLSGLSPSLPALFPALLLCPLFSSSLVSFLGLGRFGAGGFAQRGLSLVLFSLGPCLVQAYLNGPGPFRGICK